MLARLRKNLEDKEQGFTLIELLVVMIIIGILAAIAIPTFLNQRNNGYRAAMKSDLKNAAIAVESYATDNGGDYTGVGAQLAALRGAGVTADVTVVADSATATDYCLEATHALLAGETWHYSSTVGAPETGAC